MLVSSKNTTRRHRRARSLLQSPAPSAGPKRRRERTRTGVAPRRARPSAQNRPKKPRNRSTRSCISGGKAFTCSAISRLKSSCGVPLCSGIRPRGAPNTSGKTPTVALRTTQQGCPAKFGMSTTPGWLGAVLANCRDRRTTGRVPVGGRRAGTSQIANWRALKLRFTFWRMP